MEELMDIYNDDEALQMLRKIKININVPSTAPESDKGLYNLLIEGTEENDLKKVYSFVESVEMGCGFYSGEARKLNMIYDKAFEARPDEVIEILNNNSVPIDIVFNCHCICKEMKTIILKSPLLTNGFVIFELIRQLLNDMPVEELNSNSDDYKKIIGAAIIQLASTDDFLLKYFIEKFEHKEQFYTVMSAALSDMDAAGRAVYANSINIADKGSNYYKYVRIMLQGMEETSFDSFIADVYGIIYKRWSDHLSMMLINKEFVSKIALNSYSDLILNCLCKRYEDRELFFNDVENVLIEFDEYIYKWYDKSTEFNSMYYIYATKLFFLKKVQEINKILLSSRKDIYDKMNSFFQNNCMIHNKYIELSEIVLSLDLNK